jgi:hypothetical protein
MSWWTNRSLARHVSAHIHLLARLKFKQTRAYDLNTGRTEAMPKCNSCNARVVRTDAFCGTCGEPVPGAKPVVPFARGSFSSGTRPGPEHESGTFPPSPQGSSQARAVAVVALTDPDEPETELNQTTIREREKSEPAPVLPLQRRKDGTPIRSDPDKSATAEPPQGATVSSADTSLPQMPVPPGPPILASELLREQMRPSSPGDRSLQRVTVALCGAAIVGVLVAGGADPLTFVSMALLVAMITLALTPISYRSRALGLALTGGVSTGVAVWQQQLLGIDPEGVILAAATILLSGSLLFRAYYRGAMLSRVAVALGVLALGAWFITSGGHQSLVALDGRWQSWAPAATHMAFGLLAMLSLMAFMESSTRGGSHVWAAALLVLYAVHIGLLVGTELWPSESPDASIDGPAFAALITGVVGTIIAGIALAQVFVVIQQATGRRAARS